MSAQSPVPASNSRAASVALGQVAKWDDFRFRHGNINAAHKADLARVILNTGKPLSPVLLWQPPTDATTESEAERYVLLDGWHRMAAYRAAKWECPIPAIILDGGRRQALTAALSGNSHFVLPMTLEERLDAAWRLVREPVEPRFKVREVASLSWCPSSNDLEQPR